MFWFLNVTIFAIISPRIILIWTKIKLIPFTQGCSVSSLVEIGQWWWSGFSNDVNLFLLFHYYLPLGKGVTLYLNKHISFTHGCFNCWTYLFLLHIKQLGLHGHKFKSLDHPLPIIVPSLVETGPSILEKMKMLKDHRQTCWQSDSRWTTVD